ncbi:hypothetical protein L1887_48893 [Cichorium endivia]|nr:hypothetical protein L1887_48893 [Cichorium endivia]
MKNTLGTKTGLARSDIDEVRGGIADTKVPEPVGGGAERQRLGTDGQGEDLSADDPGGRAPGRGETGNVDADKGDGGLASGQVLDGHGGTDDGHDQLADAHPDGAEDEQLTAAEALHHVHARDGQLGAVVEDEVDTSELLESLDEDAGHGAKEVLSVVVLEAVEVGTGRVSELEVQVGLDDRQLGPNDRVVDIGRVEPGERLGSLLVVALLDEPTRGFGKNEEETAKEDGKGKLDTDRDAPRARVVAVLRTVVGERGAKQTNGDGPL